MIKIALSVIGAIFLLVILVVFWDMLATYAFYHELMPDFLIDARLGFGVGIAALIAKAAMGIKERSNSAPANAQ